MKWFLLNIGEILIDKKYIPVVQSATWGLTRGGYIIGSNNKYRGQYLHIILAEKAGLDTSGDIDHIDMNPRNNLLSNLRSATRSQNMMNREKQLNNTSGYKGVTWCKRYQKWQAQIQVNRKTIFLGLFEDPKEAYAAYCKAARKYHGEFFKV